MQLFDFPNNLMGRKNRAGSCNICRLHEFLLDKVIYKYAIKFYSHPNAQLQNTASSRLRVSKPNVHIDGLPVIFLHGVNGAHT